MMTSNYDVKSVYSLTKFDHCFVSCSPLPGSPCSYRSSLLFLRKISHHWGHSV